MRIKSSNIFIYGYSLYLISESSIYLFRLNIDLVTSLSGLILLSILLVILLWYLFFQGNVTPFLTFYSIPLTYTWILSVVIGLINRNPISFFLGDTFQFLLLILIPVSMIYSFTSYKDVEILLKVILYIEVAFLILSLFIFVKSGFKRTIPIGHSNFGIFVPILFLRRFLYKDKAPLFLTILSWIVIALSIMMVAASGTRTYWIEFFTFGIVYYILIPKNLKKRLIKLVLIPIILAVSAVSTFLKDISYILKTRASLLLKGESIDYNRLARLIEAKGAIKEAMKYLFFGKGFGATYFNPRSLYNLGGNNHFVHIMFAGIFLRQGIVGLVCFIISFVYLFIVSFRVILRSSQVYVREITALSLSLILSGIVGSIGMSDFLIRSIFIVGVGLIGIIYKLERRNFYDSTHKIQEYSG